METEEHLLARRYLDARARDEEAAKRAFRSLAPVVERRIRGLCHRDAGLLRAGRTTADDVVQRVLVKLWTQPPEAPEKLVSWCYQVAANAARDEARRRDNRAAVLPPEWDPPTEAHVRDRAFEDALAGCVQGLEGRYARTWSLVWEEPRLAAIDLAVALELLTEDDVREYETARRADTELPSDENDAALARRREVLDRVKKGLQNAWAARSHTLKKLQRCLRDCGFDSLPEGEWV